jgi:hypothetical protein
VGVEQSVVLSAGTVVPWTAVAERLNGRGYRVQLRMIEGLPAFPDEEPPTDWRELRAGTPAGMVTLRRTASGVSVVVWGTDDPALQAAASSLLWAIADVGDGQVETPGGPMSAAEFAQSAELPFAPM